MNVLVLGSGGREHALSWKIVQSSMCEKIYIAPGNSGTKSIGENIDIKVTDFEAIKNAEISYTEITEALEAHDLGMISDLQSKSTKIHKMQKMQKNARNVKM